MKQVILGLVACAATGTWLMAGAQTAEPAQARTPLTAPANTAPQAPSAAAQQPAAPPVQEVKFPPVDPKNFTAPSPTPQLVDTFLHAVWDVDENRVWQVAAIQPATAPGFVRVEVFVADKRQPQRIANYTFLVTPDGKHAISGELSPFAADPFAATRATLQQRADGPSRGAASKDLELVEFADLQCPSCKAAQSTMDQLVRDLPQAHVVYQNLPLTAIHPQAMLAAEVGHCVREAKGDPAFFVYAQKVYDTQGDLTAEKADATLRAAVTAAGANPATVMTCAAQPASKAAIESSIKLANDLGIAGTPTLMVNGRPLPLSQVPVATLEHVIVYQGQADGIQVKQQPSLTTLK